MGSNWITIEIIDLYPTNLGHCPHFNLLAHEMDLASTEFCPSAGQAREYPEHIVKSYSRVADLIADLKKNLRGYPVNIRIELIEATSMRGLWRSLKYRVKGNSAAIVNGRKVCEGVLDSRKIVDAVKAEAEKIAKEMRHGRS